jgi:hypothetical protein
MNLAYSFYGGLGNIGMARLIVCRQDFFDNLGKQSEKSERCQSHARVSSETSHGLGIVFPILRTLPWAVSENHSTAPPSFREPLPGSGANPSKRSRFRQYKFVANSGYRTRYPIAENLGVTLRHYLNRDPDPNPAPAGSPPPWMRRYRRWIAAAADPCGVPGWNGGSRVFD